MGFSPDSRSVQHGDEYYSPQNVVDMIVPYVSRGGYKVIWCPFDTEDSLYVKTFQKLGYEVNYGHIDTGQDFFSYTEPQGDIVVINTCGFIADAKEESINTILEFVERKRMGKLRHLYVMGCLSQRYREDLKKESFYPIGVSGIITEVNAGGYLVIRTHGRVHFDEITVYSDHTIELSVSRKPDIEDLDPAYEEDRLLKLKNVVIEYTSQFQWGALTQAYAEQWTNIGEIASIMSPWLNISNEERYALLAEDSRKARSEAMEKILYENLEMFHVNNEARNAQEEGYQKVYREQAIKKQIEYLQKELDEMHPENITDVRRFQVKIEESGMNEEARKEADKVLNRYKQEGQNSPESGMLYDYLDFITGLSWKNEDAQ